MPCKFFDRREVASEQLLDFSGVASLARHDHPMLALRQIAEAGENILVCEVRKITEDLLLIHSGGKIRKHVVHRDAHATNARLPTPLARFDRDDLTVLHRCHRTRCFSTRSGLAPGRQRLDSGYEDGRIDSR